MNAPMKILSLTLALALSPTIDAQAQVTWEPTLEGALAKAREGGKPLLISMHTSTEVACQRMLKKLYTDPAIVPILSEFVLLPTCFDDHDEVMKTIDGKKVSVSPLFGTLNCEQLRRNEADVRKTFFDKSEVKVPQHIFVGDDGKPYMKKIYELKKPAFITLLNNALVIYGSGTIVWVYVLKSVPLNYAYPFMALTFCLVPLFAWLFLGEAVTWQLAIGTALVLAGLAVITR